MIYVNTKIKEIKK